MFLRTEEGLSHDPQYGVKFFWYNRSRAYSLYNYGISSYVYNRIVYPPGLTELGPLYRELLSCYS